MTVLVDDPSGPPTEALGYLVSDSDLDELHAWRGRGIPPRAFDRDHYDVPADARRGSSPPVHSTWAARSSPGV